MSSPTSRHQVEECAIQLLDDGQGFALDLIDGEGHAVRVACPTWMLHQLMRMLPRVDAALHPTHCLPAAALVGYPVQAWLFEPAPGSGLALSLRTTQQVEAGFCFSLADARRFQHALGEAIAAAETAQLASSLR